MKFWRRDFWMALGALALPAAAAQSSSSGKKKSVFYRGKKPSGTPLYSEIISHGDLIFISGHGTNKVQGIREQTEFVLNEIEACLKTAGSSMNNVLKCNVYLAKLDDYKPMNDAYVGRFGMEPPVRTTVAVAGIPLDGALVEIEVIAHR
ncbi:MAG TPA: RidA family protein [Bryobacteraceae bacterium]|nr:RidA family protein [Bryobacteraceae bacterium]